MSAVGHNRIIFDSKHHGAVPPFHLDHDDRRGILSCPLSRGHQQLTSKLTEAATASMALCSARAQATPHLSDFD